MSLSKTLLWVFSLCSLLSFSVYAEDIRVLSAVVKDKVIEDAKITWQRNGEPSQRATTNSSGNATGNPFGDGNGTTLLIEKAGYSTLIVKCPCDGFTYALSPEMTNLDGLRVVLTWGKHPSDLDSHLSFPGNNIFYNDRTGADANLDVDDRSSYGPETITIEKRKVGQRYVYAVRDYTNFTNRKSDTLANSQARVEVYIGRTLMRTYKVQKDVIASTWVVFGIDGNGAFHDINQYISLTSESGIFRHLEDIVAADTFDTNSIVTDAMKAQARRLNTQGEKVYSQKDYTAAMYLFLEAVNLNPEFSQAYSNLGVTYPKLDRNAEALWANRKAIELASGNRASTVKASSYYNIARIYEKSGAWQDALTHFEKALSYREHNAYRKGITRMREQLGQ